MRKPDKQRQLTSALTALAYGCATLSPPAYAEEQLSIPEQISEVRSEVTALQKQVGDMEAQLKTMTLLLTNQKLPKEQLAKSIALVEKDAQFKLDGMKQGVHDSLKKEQSKLTGRLAKLSEAKSAEEVQKVIADVKAHSKKLDALKEKTIGEFEKAIRGVTMPKYDVETVRLRYQGKLKAALERLEGRKIGAEEDLKALLKKSKDYTDEGVWSRRLIDAFPEAFPHGDADQKKKIIDAAVRSIEADNMNQLMATTSSMLLSQALASGNPYVIAAVVVIMALIAIFSKKGGGGGGKGKKKGPKQGSESTVPSSKKPTRGPNKLAAAGGGSDIKGSGGGSVVFRRIGNWEYVAQENGQNLFTLDFSKLVNDPGKTPPSDKNLEAAKNPPNAAQIKIFYVDYYPSNERFIVNKLIVKEIGGKGRRGWIRELIDGKNAPNADKFSIKGRVFAISFPTHIQDEDRPLNMPLEQWKKFNP